MRIEKNKKKGKYDKKTKQKKKMYQANENSHAEIPTYTVMF